MGICSVSVAIPTLDRATSCIELIDQLLPMLPRDAEMVIIAQGERFDPPADERIRLVHLPRPSLTRARNAALAAARGEIILFLDDDCGVSQDLIGTHVDVHRTNPGYGIVYGMVRDRHNPGTGQTLVEFDVNTLTLKTDYGISRQEQVICGPGCHNSIKREVFKRIRFDPWFRGNAQFEEIDYALRVQRHLGLPLLFTNRAVVDHHMAEEGGCRSVRTASGFYYDRFFNKSLCFAKNGPLSSTQRFLRQQKGEIEYFSRRGSGRSWELVGASFNGLCAGYVAGVIRRCGGQRVLPEKVYPQTQSSPPS